MFKGIFNRQQERPPAANAPVPPQQEPQLQQQRECRPAGTLPARKIAPPPAPPAGMLPARKIAPPLPTPSAPDSRQQALNVLLLGELIKAKISDPDAVMLVAESSKEALSSKPVPKLNWSLLSDLNKSILAFCK